MNNLRVLSVKYFNNLKHSAISCNNTLKLANTVKRRCFYQCYQFSSSSQPQPLPKDTPSTREEQSAEIEEVKLDADLINHLERTSLVDFDNEEALKTLQEAIKFANILFEVDTKGVEPLITVLEDESVYLREDEVAPTKREDILANASVTEEDYFVAPPGNIPLEPQQLYKNKK